MDFWDKCETENVAAICVNRIDRDGCCNPKQRKCQKLQKMIKEKKKTYEFYLF